MAKKKKFTAKQLKHDPFRDWYEKQAEWAGQHRQSIYRNISITVGTIVLVIGSIIGYSFWTDAAEERLGNAFDIFNAQVTEEPPADTNQRTYKKEEDKYRAALEAYRRVSEPWYWRLTDYADTAKYFAAVCQLHLASEESQGKAQLEQMVDDDSTTGRLARVALAEYLLTKGDGAGAEKYYRQLVESPGDLPKPRLQLELARALEAQGKKQDAVNLYLQVARDNKKEPIAREAVTRLAALDPAALDQAPSEDEMQGETDVLAKYKKK
jgi:tetratricopeptide (TPR) repeat protein